jgi:endo-1,4-beta-xylanase
VSGGRIRNSIVTALLACALGATAGCGTDHPRPAHSLDTNTTGEAGASGAAATCPTTSLKDAAACSGRSIGAALAAERLSEDAYANRALEFNYVTPENEMKWLNVEPTRDEFAFDASDQVADFAERNGMKLKGHTLVWQNQLPDWVTALTDPDDLRAALLNHVTTVVEHFRGRVAAWDVVNEAWDPVNPTLLRDSVFSELLGPSFIDDAFTAARAADPDAKLYYNDYGADGLGTKSDSIYAMVADMKARGIPIDGVGLQMHWHAADTRPSASDVAANMARLGALGLEVVVSEMDVSLCNGGSVEQQTDKSHAVVAACLNQPSCTAVTFWGITDKYSWLNYFDTSCADGETPRPLLFDDDYQKKPAYTAVLNALAEQ